MKRYVIGTDYGTLSARTVLVDVVTGEEVSESVFVYPDVPAAASALSKPIERVYLPNPENVPVYDRIYREYETLANYFGRQNPVMKTLGSLKKEVLQ